MNDQDFAIIIGIDGYPQLPLLNGAHEDAMEFKKWLVSPDGGWLPDSDSNIQILLSPDGIVANPAKAFPKKDDIDIALDSFGLGNPNFEGRIGRRLYFYFSGHGVGPNFDDVAILMANASINHLNN